MPSSTPPTPSSSMAAVWRRPSPAAAVRRSSRRATRGGGRTDSPATIARRAPGPAATPTGIFAFPKPRAAALIYEAIAQFFTAHPTGSLKRVELVLLDQPTLEVFLELFAQRFPHSTLTPHPSPGQTPGRGAG